MRAKRLLDLCLLLPVLPLYALLLGALAAFVRLIDGAPVFFLQTRAGRGRRPFRVFKLRTMSTEVDFEDRRPTTLGGFLRRRGLDELPQLLNILRGEMSLVGPRPLAVEDAARLVAVHPPFAARFDLPPGLTGPAQVLNLRGVERTAEVEAAYAETRSALGDVAILARTAWINVVGKPRSTTAFVAPRRSHRVRNVALVTLGTLLAGWTAVGHEVNRLRVLKEDGGPAAFNTLDLASASALNVVMALGGYVAGYPEVADETLLLFVPGVGETREFQSDFAMRASEIRKAARELVRRLDEGEAAPRTTVRLDGPLQVRLAFSVPFELRAVRVPGGIDFTVHTAIIYPRRAAFPLGPSPTGAPILFDEGIYWVLQERGWFHPYWANWSWMMRADDPRLQPGEVTPTVRERATVGVWHALLQLSAHR